MIALILAGSLAASGPPAYAATATRRVGLDAAAALDLVEGLFTALQQHRADLKGRPLGPRAFAAMLANARMDPGACGGATACAAALGRIGDVAWVFSVQLVRVGDRVIVDVELVRVADGATRATASASVPAQRPQTALVTLAEEIAGKAPDLEEDAQPPVPKKSEPVAAAAPAAARAPEPAIRTPEPDPEPPPRRPAPSMGVGRKVAMGLGAASLAGFGVGGYFGVTALGQSEQLRSSSPSYAEDRDRMYGTARTADVVYGAAAALAIAAIVAWIAGGRSGDAEASP